MGLRFEGVNPESQKRLERIIADGKVNGTEVARLTPAEKEALAKALGGKALPVGSEELSLFKEPAPEKKETSWGDVALGIGLVGAGAVVGFLAGGPAGAIGGAALVGTLFGAQSCTPININQEVNIQIPVYNDLDRLIESNEKNTELLNKLLLELENQGQSIQMIVETLAKMGNSLGDILALLAQSNKNQTDILNAISNGNDKMSAFLEKNFGEILNVLKEGNNINEENKKLLTLILEQLTLLGTKELPDNAETNALLEKLTALLTEFITQEKGADAVTQELLTKILNAITEYSDGSKKLLNELLGLISHSNATINIIVEKMNNIQGGNVVVDFGELKELLAAILEVSKQNGDKLNSLNGKTGTVIVLLEGLKQSVDAGNTEILNKLDEIINKMGNGQCCECNLEDVIAKLEIIINKMEGGNHEGILDDLDNLLG